MVSGAVFHSVGQLWLSSGLPECFTFSNCAWLWNWLSESNSRNTALQSIYKTKTEDCLHFVEKKTLPNLQNEEWYKTIANFISYFRIFEALHVTHELLTLATCIPCILRNMKLMQDRFNHLHVSLFTLLF